MIILIKLLERANLIAKKIKNHTNFMNWVVEERERKRRNRTKPSRDQVDNEGFLRRRIIDNGFCVQVFKGSFETFTLLVLVMIIV
jgi:hypothetical protein